MKNKRILFTSIDGFIGSHILSSFKGKNNFFLTDKIDRVNNKERIFHFKDFENIIRTKNIDIVFNNRGILLGSPSKLDRINFDSPKVNYGIGVNLEINKNLSLEATLNPDFSQVESDVTKIDINSPTAINYPERRPFFNRGIDVLDYTMDVIYSRSINNPSFASKILNQGKKSRIYMLTAVDQDSPYIVPTQFESFSGVGGKSFNNILRYQNIINPNI